MRQLCYYQDEYNLGGNDREISLVFFADAVRHLLRIARILRSPRGNAILIGLAGETASALPIKSEKMRYVLCVRRYL